ncbi:TPR repeat protein-like protein [Patellaria atrata CBS 101060]|uniref:TPR repeat protein-like protein n=1 Tax=Patellaria atrata CBS 101060 TaxID=1346257 RepID=A0A9P4VMI1_9PEZI|nr:TPR repeat protein-like protein [Patellaria atrata CBS 101060]
MPPAMASVKERTADELLQELNRTPLFMTTLDETDGEGGENVELEALKALVFEGTRAEVAANFREQANELAKIKNWVDAKEFYTKALAALKTPLQQVDSEAGAADMSAVEVDEEAERKKERELEEACYVNRALCNLKRQNYRSCNLDCAATLHLNPLNIKAWYRSASACLALNKIAEAQDACERGLAIDEKNIALKTLSTKIIKRKDHLNVLERKRRERDECLRAEELTLKKALKNRNIATRSTTKAPEMEDAAIKLADPVDSSSTLTLPAIFLYPVHLQSDFVKSFQETESLADHLSYIFPLPWDQDQEYTTANVECYMETSSGGLIKAGKKLPLARVLGSGKVEVVDQLVKIQVIPKQKVPGWLDEFKKKRVST